MKKTFLFTFAVLIFSLGFSQENFKWEKTDSLGKSKAQIYSDTKLFIAQKWKSMNDVVQNDDKDGGIILLKGADIRKETFMGSVYTYIYNYNVTFKMKDNRYKIIIDNVRCESASCKGSAVKLIEPFEGDNCPSTSNGSTVGIPKKKAIIMMADFKKSLQSIVDDYEKQIKVESTTEKW